MRKNRNRKRFGYRQVFFRPFFLWMFSLGFGFGAPSVYGEADQKRPIPRFASMRSSEVNVRRGPGPQYQIDWIYRRVGLPVEIIAEYGTWRKIRDHEGAEGWVHQAMLSGKRHTIITASRTKLFKRPLKETGFGAILAKDVVARVLECGKDRCKVQIDRHKGWVERSHMWGVKTDELTFK